MRKGRKPSPCVITISRCGAVGIRKGCPPVGAIVSETKGAESRGCHLIEPAPGVVAVGDVKDSGASHLTILTYEGIYSLFPNLFWKFAV